MERIRQLIVAGGSTGLTIPETALRLFLDLFARQCVGGSGWNAAATALVPRTGSTVTVVLVNGVTVRLAANSVAPALTGFNLTTGQHGAVLTTSDAGGTLRNYFTSPAASAAAIQYPAIPPTEAVIGVTYFAPTVTFTGGTTALDAANVNATFVSVSGPFYPVNSF
jgi:hypothetical protein